MARKQTSESRNTTKSKSNVTPLKPQSQASTRSTSSGPGTGKMKKAEPVTLTHEQIAERAKGIWRERGCQTGQDESNWLEAEKQLKQELSSR